MQKRVSRIKILLLLGVLLLALALGPHVYCRITAAERAVQIKVLNVNALPVIDGGLRIGAFNIAHGRGAEPDAPNDTGESQAVRLDRLNAIAKIIRHESLDIAVLNEVDFDC